MQLYLLIEDYYDSSPDISSQAPFLVAIIDIMLTHVKRQCWIVNRKIRFSSLHFNVLEQILYFNHIVNIPGSGFISLLSVLVH